MKSRVIDLLNSRKATRAISSEPLSSQYVSMLVEVAKIL